MGSILRNNRRIFWEILNNGQKKGIIGTGLVDRKNKGGAHSDRIIM